MSVSNQTNKTYGSGNGVTTTFSYPFKIFDVSELYAYKIAADGTVTGPLTYNTDFTATISSVTEGGTITFIVAPASGTTWFLKRIVPQTQSASIPSEGTFPGKQFENQLDLLTMMAIQTNESVTRCLQLGATFTGTLPLEIPTGLANAAIGWDATGNTLTNLQITSVGPVSVPISNANLVILTASGLVSGASLFSLASIPSGAGIIPVANIPVGTTANKVVQLNGSAQLPAVDGSLLTNTSKPYIKVSNTQTQNTNGGTATSGSWLTYPLNTKDSDTSSIATLAASKITLPAGTYQVRASIPFYTVTNAQAKLFNNTDSSTLLVGNTVYSPASDTSSPSIITGQITLAATKDLFVQYQVASTVSTTGLGVAANFGTEVYGIIEFTKIA